MRKNVVESHALGPAKARGGPHTCEDNFGLLCLRERLWQKPLSYEHLLADRVQHVRNMDIFVALSLLDACSTYS